MHECCGRSFETKALRQHLDNSYAHSNEIECRWCFARWPTHDGRLRLKHEKRHHWYRCEDCTWMFDSKDGLQEHIDEEHPPNYCYGCQRSFKSLNNLKMVSLAPLCNPHENDKTTIAPQIISPCRKECQVSLVLEQIHQPDRRLSALGIRQLYIRYQPPKDQPVLPRR